jgi:uncharacterized Fe-S center protein
MDREPGFPPGAAGRECGRASAGAGVRRYDEPPLVVDVGFLASENPAALDSATLDLVNFAVKNQQSRFHEQIKDKEDIFMAMREGTKSSLWFDYCSELGLGSEYQLITI